MRVFVALFAVFVALVAAAPITSTNSMNHAAGSIPPESKKPVIATNLPAPAAAPVVKDAPVAVKDGKVSKGGAAVPTTNLVPEPKPMVPTELKAKAESWELKAEAPEVLPKAMSGLAATVGESLPKNMGMPAVGGQAKDKADLLQADETPADKMESNIPDNPVTNTVSATPSMPSEIAEVAVEPAAVDQINGGAGGIKPKMTGYVINLPEDTGRYEVFTGWWQENYPGLPITRVEGIRDPVRGRGLTESFLKGLKLAMNAPPEDQTDVVVFFEDDAKPFAREGIKTFTQTMDDLLVTNGGGGDPWPTDAKIMMLGGHHIGCEGGLPCVPDLRDNSVGITRITAAWGTYAWAVKKEYMPTLFQHWTDYLKTDREWYAPDESWHTLWSASKIAYVATPLLIDHCPESASNTWANDPDQVKAMNIQNSYAAFEGKPNWWELEAWDPTPNYERAHLSSHLMLASLADGTAPAAPALNLAATSVEQQATCELAMAACAKSSACSLASERCECMPCSSSSDIIHCYNCNVGNLGQAKVEEEKANQARYEGLKPVNQGVEEFPDENLY